MSYCSPTHRGPWDNCQQSASREKQDLGQDHTPMSPLGWENTEEVDDWSGLVGRGGTTANRQHVPGFKRPLLPSPA